MRPNEDAPRGGSRGGAGDRVPWDRFSGPIIAPIDRLLERLQGVKPAGSDKWTANCSAHPDSNASLSLRVTPDGRILIHCFADCAAADIVGSVGLTLSDLFPDGGQRTAPMPRIPRAPDPAERERADQAARIARLVWRAGSPADAHPYLARKRVRAVPTLRQIGAGRFRKLAGYVPMGLAGDLLVVPLRSDGRLQSLELIDPAGGKRSLRGGSKRGAYWAAQPALGADAGGGMLLLAEGVATALSCAEAMRAPAFAALGLENVQHVGRALLGRYPNAHLIVCADVTRGDRTPHPRAVEAAAALGADLAYPTFPPGDDRSTDFNDLHLSAGAAAVMEHISAALSGTEHQ